jgi:hypothetical protein
METEHMEKFQSDPIGFGPQHPRDNPFTARMRFHQSWYRVKVLKAPFGVGPKPRNSSQYGNMLTVSDGERGLNFLTPHIFEIVKRRLAHQKGMMDSFRLLNNLLSSQPLSFNLFAPLVDDIELATRLFQTLLPGTIQNVTKVTLEFSPEPAKEYLNDRTAFDAFIEYEDPSGKMGFIGIETKLTESFTPKSYTSPFYTRWFNEASAPWLATALPQLQEIQVNQLWRDHLLAVAMQLSPLSHYASGHFMLIYHPLDAECRAALEVYKTLLRPGEPTFIHLSLDQVIERWRGEVNSTATSNWLSDFSLRYLDLEASEADFQAQNLIS